MVKFTFENGWIYGEDNFKTAKISDAADFFDTDKQTTHVGNKLLVKFDTKYLKDVIDKLNNDRLEHAKKGAVNEWKYLNNIAINGTPLDLIVDILNGWDETQCGFEVDECCEYIDVSLPFGTYTIILKNEKVDRLSTIVEVFDGDSCLIEGGIVYTKEDGTLDIKK